jgi:hypothetical protein
MSYRSADPRRGTDSWKQVDEVPEVAARGAHSWDPACNGNRSPLRKDRQRAARDLANGKWHRSQEVSAKGAGHDRVCSEIDQRYPIRSSEKSDDSCEAVAEFVCRRRPGQCKKLVWLSKHAPPVGELPERKYDRIGRAEQALRRC